MNRSPDRLRFLKKEEDSVRYRCLVFDHDDTTVNSTSTIHYPCFVEFMKQKRPSLRYTLEEYVRYNFDPGVIPFFRDICGLTEAELLEEQEYWFAYAGRHVSDAFPGIRELMLRQKQAGGLIAVVSHSYADNILRDYAHNDLPTPDVLFGWEQPREERKPSPVPLKRIMERFGLRPEELLVIDDLKPGLDMARAAGVPFAAAGWCFHIPENETVMRTHADFYFDTVEALQRHCFPQTEEGGIAHEI